MLTRPRRPTYPPPPAWCPMAKALWSFAPEEATRFWHALLGSRATVPCQFKHQALTLKVATLDDLLSYAQRIWTPAAVVEVIEALCWERRLSRAHATRLEERIFTRTTREGLWR